MACNRDRGGTGPFIVCHGSSFYHDLIHRMCIINEDGHHIVHSHGGLPGLLSGQYNVLALLTIDDNRLVFVVDMFNKKHLKKCWAHSPLRAASRGSRPFTRGR